MSLNIAKVNHFFTSSAYIVVGALNDPAKFGYKVLNWYATRDMNVVPVNPKSATVAGIPAASDLVAAVGRVLSANPDAKISISFITPPAITLKTLEALGGLEGYPSIVNGLWFQPGSFDTLVLDYTDKLAVYDRVVENGDCILVLGDQGRRSVASL